MEHKDLHDLLKHQQYSFKPYFSDRVMNRLDLAKEKVEDSFIQALDYLFPRIAVPSFAILTVVLVFAVMTSESMDINTLVGLNGYEEDLLLQKF